VGRKGQQRFSDEILSDFLDQRLDDERHAEVAAAIDTDPELATRIAALRAQDAQLRALATEVLEEPIPTRLSEVLQRASPEAAPSPRPASAAAPARRWPGRDLLRIAAVLLIGVALGWTVRAQLATEPDLLEPFVRQAVLSHELFRTTGDPQALAGERPLREIGEIQIPFGTPVRVPELLGPYRPVVLRAEQTGSAAGLNVGYQREGGGLTSLLIRQHSSSDDIPVHFTQRGGHSVLYWLDGPLVYALVGDETEADLRALARHIYTAAAKGGEWKQPSGADPALPAAAD
jgi:anti-sigma factor RsiW